MTGGPIADRLRAARARLAATDAAPDAIARADGPPEPSFEQERVWLVDRLNAGSADYNVPSALLVEGEFDTAAFGRALDALVAAHEVFRTTFREDDGRPRPVVRPAGPVPLETVNVPRSDPEALRLAAADHADRPFDLAADLPVRATVLTCADDTRLVLLTLHHIATDGRSTDLLWRELAERYAAEVQGRPPQVEPPQTRYADFAAWQRRDPALDTDLDYWAGRLAGVPDQTIPTDRPHRAGGGQVGAEVEFTVPADLADRLRRIAVDRDATTYMTLLAAFKALLATLGGHPDVAVGTPVAGRVRPELDRLLGSFVNILVLRTDTAGVSGFADLLDRVRDTALQAFAHQAAPFARVVERVRPTRDADRNPLFQVMFATEQSGTAPSLPGARTRPVRLPVSRSKFDLSLAVTDDGPGTAMTGSLTYPTGVFDEATVRGLADQYLTVLRAVAERPDLPATRLLTPADDQRARGTGPALELGTADLPTLILAQAERTPDAVAVSGGHDLTYRELNERSARLAARLRARGVVRDSVVGVCLDRTPGLVVAMLAVLRAGAAYVPVDPAYSRERVGHMLTDSGTRLVLVDDTTAGLSWNDLGVTPLDTDAPVPCGAATLAPPPPDLDALAYLIYTSGSTGRPKGVMVPHRGLVNFARDMTARLSLGPGDAVAALTTVSFDIAVLELLVPLAAGARVEIVDRDTTADGVLLGKELDRRGVTVVQATPAGWSLLVAAGWTGEHVRALCGGEALPHTLAREIRARVARLWNVYGPTETTVWSTAQEVGDAPATGHGPPLGTPLANTTVHVLDPELVPVPAGAVGELFLGGLGLARGYAGLPAMTAERFVPDPWGPPGARMYRTGDLARRRADGRLEYLGRTDHQIKVRGHRIEAGEIEARLLEHPGVDHAVVTAHGEGAARDLVAYLVPRPGSGTAWPDVRAWLAEVLPAYMVPARAVTLDGMPLTPNGKVDRRALPAPGPARAAEHLAPRTDAERRLARVWERVLDVTGAGVLDDFFESGGHSLQAARLVAGLRDELGVEIPMRTVFDRPTIADLAESLNRARTAEPVSPTPDRPATDDGPAPPSFAQRRLWFLDRLRPGRADYNVPSAVRLRGPLDAEALHTALRHVIARNDALRTALTPGPDGPVQTVVPPPENPLTFEDAATEQQALDRLDEWCAQPFDLAGGAPVRALLLRLSDGDHLLALLFHHIAVDGWSLPILWSQLAAAYRGTPEPAAPAVRFADFARWEHARTDAHEADLTYWRERLAGSAPTEIPTDRPRPAAFGADAAVVDLHVPAALCRRLERAGRDAGATPFMVYLAAFTATVSALSGRDDVVLGTPVAGSGRQRAEFTGLVGPLLNTVALRADVDWRAGFAELTRRVRQAVLEANDHQDLPFERLVEELSPGRDLSRHPLFQIMFAFDDDEAAALDLPGLHATLVRPREVGAKFDLSLALTRDGDGMTATLVHATDLYTADTARRIVDVYRRVLEAAADDPAAPLPALDLLDGRALARFTAEPAAPADTCLHTLVERAAADAPDAVALECGHQTVTYAGLLARAEQVAARLRRAGARPGRRVGVLLPRSPDLVAALLGVLKTGAACVPMDLAQPPGRVAALLEAADVNAVLTADGLEVRTPGPAADPVPVLPDDIAYLTFTSGSTGRPKPVPTTHAAAVAFLEHLLGEYRIHRHDTALQLAAPSFDASVRDTFGPLAAGARLVLPPGDLARDPRAVVAMAADRGVTVLPSVVPSLLGALARAADGRLLPRLRLVLTSGEALTPAVVRATLAMAPNARIVNQYGPTETTMTSTFHHVTEADLAAGTIPVGVPIPGTRALVLAPDGRPLPTGAAGELHLGGPRVSAGYLGAPSLTAERFVPDPGGPPGSRLYRTGDLVRFGDDGRLRFLGRLDDQVKVRGVRVAPAEVEAALREVPGVRDAAVLARRNDGATELTAYVVPVTGHTLDGVREALRDLLPEQMRPTAYVRLDALPTTAHGKTDRRALAALEPEPARPAADAPLPRDRTEIRLLTLVETVLGRSPVGVGDDFFDLGGHSLKAVDLVERVRRTMGVDLPLNAVFRNPTVARLAAEIRAAADTTRAWTPLVPLTGDTAPGRTPLFLVHPQSGDVACYVGLVRELGDRRPVYGLEAVGYSTDDPPLTAIPAMARRYVEAVRAVQPHGPYLLGGWSFGGTVALEMAALLERDGESVAFLGAIDARAFGADGQEEWYERNTELARFGIAHGLDRDALRDPSDQDVLELLTRHLTDAERLPARADTRTLRRMVDVFTANGRAADDYRPGAPVTAPVHLFRTTGRHPTLTNPEVNPDSWRHRTHGPVHVVDLDGNHHDLASPPHVAGFARRLATAVDQAAGDGPNERR